jgi:hypothetical protein
MGPLTLSSGEAPGRKKAPRNGNKMRCPRTTLLQDVKYIPRTRNMGIGREIWREKVADPGDI